MVTLESFLALPKNGLSHLGQFNPPTDSPIEVGIKVSLQRFELLGDRRLCDVECFRRSGHATVSGGSRENLETIQGHDDPSASIAASCSGGNIGRCSTKKQQGQARINITVRLSIL